MPIRILLSAIALALMVPGPLDSAPAGQIHTVLIKGFKFVPDKLEVQVGDTVIWKNEDIVPHTATAKKLFDSKKLDQGQSWSYVARQKGSHPYICLYHPTMTGELVVK
jgi:plastocyanin